MCSHFLWHELFENVEIDIASSPETMNRREVLVGKKLQEKWNSLDKNPMKG